MIDCGIAFNKMKEDLYKCQYLLITHDHQDHVKPVVLNKIVEQFPNIEIYSTYKVARLNDAVTAINTDYLPMELAKAGCEMWAVPVPHNTLCFGYVLAFDDLNVLYATDLTNTEELSEFSSGNCFLPLQKSQADLPISSTERKAARKKSALEQKRSLRRFKRFFLRC